MRESPQCPHCGGSLMYTKRIGLIEGGPMVLMLVCNKECGYQFPKQVRTWQDERADLLAYFGGHWEAHAFTDWGDAIAELRATVEASKHVGAAERARKEGDDG